jgi:hypothetical protein
MQRTDHDFSRMKGQESVIFVRVDGDDTGWVEWACIFQHANNPPRNRVMLAFPFDEGER